jgi:hypothetical protein
MHIEYARLTHGDEIFILKRLTDPNFVLEDSNGTVKGTELSKTSVRDELLPISGDQLMGSDACVVDEIV